MSFLPGEKYTVFECPTFKFGVIICWENLFPDLVREFVKNGAQGIINITNEAWFGRSVGPQHYVISSIFRAVENRVYVIRCANTGVSCFIDPYGRVVKRVRDEVGRDIFVRGVATEAITPLNPNTIYTRNGDVLVWLSIVVFVGFLFVAAMPRDRAESYPWS
ncbi:MAG: hypothetical protein JRI52_06345 [Deltaproteobacteria bacterium]|nr:hypothetical protein [Deltaproteobacteria bacterium]